MGSLMSEKTPIYAGEGIQEIKVYCVQKYKKKRRREAGNIGSLS